MADDSPPSKKAKVSSPSPQRTTRSSATREAQASAPIVPPVDSSLADDEDDDEPFEYESDQYDEDVTMVVDGQAVRGGVVPSLVVLDSEDELVAPPEPLFVPKPKLSSRKLFLRDIGELVGTYGSNAGLEVRNFERDGDENVRFRVIHPAFNEGLKLVLGVPETSGYPTTHLMHCYTESEVIGPDVQVVLGEIATLPPQADRSLAGVVRYLVERLVMGEPAPWTIPGTQSQQQLEESDAGASDFDDDLYGMGSVLVSQKETSTKALREDFKGLIAAGYRPGFARISELDHIVTVSKKINTLGIPVLALQAWDSALIDSGEVRYLVLLINFGANYPVNPDDGTRGEVQFRVGISPHYKPSKAAIAAAFRSASSHSYTEGEFEAISLSVPLDSLFSDKFQEILLRRRQNPGIGWAGAEHHCLALIKSDGTLNASECKAADLAEKEISGSYTLPPDPMAPGSKTADNYPLLAFSYLLRRFIMCPRFCLVCFKKIDTDIVGALKPFVCPVPLCLFQLISLGLGPSLEHELQTNGPSVDLLIQLTYLAARDGLLKGDLQPEGLSLEVPRPGIWKFGDPTVEFDSLDVVARNTGLARLIEGLPPVAEMVAFLSGADLRPHEKQLTRARRLADLRGGKVSNSAWKLLRWIVASNTSYLKQITEPDELVQGVPRAYRQFRLVVGSATKEHLLAKNVLDAQARNANARTFPTLYAWHGSAVGNWHSILRQGLHFDKTTNGRAYGNGVYFAKQGEVSMHHYAQASHTSWKNAGFSVSKLAAVCEIVNLPAEFVSTNPYFVVNNLDWIQCRVLIVDGTNRGALSDTSASTGPAVDDDFNILPADAQLTQPTPLDPAHPVTLNVHRIVIPNLLPKLRKIEAKLDVKEEDLSPSDDELVHEVKPESQSPRKGSLRSHGSGSQVLVVKDSFRPASDDIIKLVRLLPPPKHPNPGAAINIQREMKTMLSTQKAEGSTACGYYYDPERSGDNMFTWVVELCGFDPDLPISKDLKSKGLSSLVCEIRFPESYPMSPPFIRIVYPRFLPFIHGGGGHITGGGSICHELLTSTGWSPAYAMGSILLQIRMAISNLHPRPARLDPQTWSLPYTMSEAVEGFRRAANTHGWAIDPDLDKLTRS